MKKVLLSFGFIACSLFASAQTSGLFADYNFNTCNAADAVGPKANGKFKQVTTNNADRFGNPGAAAGFNGSNSTDSIGAPSKALVSNGLTISAWVKCSSTGGQQAIVAKWANSTPNDQYILMVNNGYLVMAVGNPSASASGFTSTSMISSSTWYHVVAAWDNTGAHEIYINGSLNASTINSSFQTINSTSPTKLYIGSQQGTGRFFNGLIDDVKLFDRRLSASEISSLYNEPNWNTGSNLVSKYTFDNGLQTDEVNNNDPVFTGYSATADRFGNAASALNITPSTSYLNFADSYDGFATSTAGKASFSFWINFNNISSAYQIILAKSADGGCAGNDRQFLFRLNASNKLEISTYGTNTAGNFLVMETSPVFTTGGWHHVVLTYDGSLSGGSKFGIYIDNNAYAFSQVNTSGSGIASGPQDASACFAVGTYLKADSTFCNNVQRLDAKFDNFYVFSKVLSASEVNDLYNEPDPATIGLNEFVKPSKHMVFPNPFNDQLTLTMTNKGKFTSIKVVSLEGKTIKEFNTTQDEYIIGTAEYPRGLYFVMISNEDGTEVKKLIKQ